MKISKEDRVWNGLSVEAKKNFVILLKEMMELEVASDKNTVGVVLRAKKKEFVIVRMK